MAYGKSDAKKMMLKSLSKEMRDMMGEGLEGDLKDKMMKVSVAGESPEDIEEGLDLAEEIMKMRMGEESEEMPEMESDEEDDMEYEDEDYQEDDNDEEEMMSEDLSAEEIQSKIEELKSKLSDLQG